MSKKRPSYKDIYNKDYMRDELGSYIYTGEYYSFDLPPGKLKRLKFIYFSIALAVLVLFAAGGYVNNPGSRVIYVILPYITMFLPIAFMLADTVKIIFSDNKMTYKQYNRSVLQLKRSCVALSVISAAAAAGDLIYIIFKGGRAVFFAEMPFLLVCSAICSISIIFIFIQKKTPCISTPKRAL